MRTVGVPYSPEEIATASDDALAQGAQIATGIHEQTGVELAPNSEMIALISYLQRLGRPPEGGGGGESDIPEQPVEVVRAGTVDGQE